MLYVRKHIPALLAGLVAIILFISGCASKQSETKPEENAISINLDHLEHLQRVVNVEGKECLGINIYANAPTYSWTGDEDEGIVCVDDVARAARLYLWRYETTGDTAVIYPAIELLKYVLALQAEDGNFYNFIWEDGKINRTHENSVKSMGWWGARGFRSIAEGVAVLSDAFPKGKAENPPFLKDLLNAGNMSISRMRSTYLESENPPEIGHDVAALFVLGLVRWHEALNDTTNDDLIEYFANQVYNAAEPPSEMFPYRVHRSWRNVWHAYGSLSVQALLEAGKVLNREDWINSAKEEADGFQRWLIAEGMMAHIEFVDGDTVNTRRFSQIAYDIACLVACQVEMYELTGNEEYAIAAGLAASWLNGNNPAGEKMYDQITGRCFDGINADSTVNKNSGAESTIEALFALHLIENLPKAREAFYSTKEIDNIPESATYKSGDRSYILQIEDNKWTIKTN